MASIRNGPLYEIQKDLEALMKAEFQARAEAERTSEQSVQAQKRFLRELLEVMDHFDRVFDNIAPKEAAAERLARTWAGNFRSIRKNLEGKLKEYGLFFFEAPEGKVVPGFHTVVETVQNLDFDDGTIVKEIRKGYLWRDEVLRKAEVVAVKN